MNYETVHAEAPTLQVNHNTSTGTDNTNPSRALEKPLSKFDPRRYRDAELVRMEDTVAGGLKTQTIIPVRKPNKRGFVRVHPQPDYQVRNLPTIEDPATGDIYLLGPDLDLPYDLENKVDFLNLATAVTADGSLFLWHYKTPPTIGRTRPGSHKRGRHRPGFV